MRAKSGPLATSALEARAAAPISPATRSARSPSMSATSTLAPSAANRLAMPSPKPKPAPVTIATLPSSRMPPSPN